MSDYYETFVDGEPAYGGPWERIKDGKRVPAVARQKEGLERFEMKRRMEPEAEVVSMEPLDVGPWVRYSDVQRLMPDEQKEGRRWTLTNKRDPGNCIYSGPGLERDEMVEVMPVSEALEKIEAAERDAMRADNEAIDAVADLEAAEKRAEGYREALERGADVLDEAGFNLTAAEIRPTALSQPQ